MLKRATFVTIEKLKDTNGKDWEIGQQDDEIIIVTACGKCGEEFSALMTVLGSSALSHDLFAKCRNVDFVPREIENKTRPLVRALHEKGWETRAGSGGPSQWIPDC